MVTSHLLNLQKIVLSQVTHHCFIKLRNLKWHLKSKPVHVLQEDVQGFGILAEQKTSIEEVFQYHVTTVPLSTSEGEASRLDLKMI